MRVVFPTDQNIGYLSKRGAHFGKAKFYTVITLEKEKIADVEVFENPGHEGSCGGAITNIMNLKPDALIVSGIGSSPAKGFFNEGLDIYFDKKSPKVEDSIKMLISGQLEKLGNKGTCSSH